MSTVKRAVPTTADQPANLEQVGKLSQWRSILLKYPSVTAPQMAICEHFIRFPTSGRIDIAAACGVSESCVRKWMSAPDFWSVVGEFDLGQMQRTQALALLSAKLYELRERPGRLTVEDGTWLDRVAKWTGITKDVPQAVSYASAVVGDLHAQVRQRAEELSRGIQEELGLVSPLKGTSRGEMSGEKRVADSQAAVAAGSAGSEGGK